MCMFRYYKDMYSCVRNWLHDKTNCSIAAVTSVMEAVHQFILPFTTIYDCPIITTPITPGSFCYISGYFYNLGDVQGRNVSENTTTNADRTCPTEKQLFDCFTAIDLKIVSKSVGSF